jgi:hypothetical protein
MTAVLARNDIFCHLFGHFPYGAGGSGGESCSGATLAKLVRRPTSSITRATGSA